jgi:hypothetical protein
LAKSKNRAADGFANVWQFRAIFAKHWQNTLGRGGWMPPQKKRGPLWMRPALGGWRMF